MNYIFFFLGGLIGYFIFALLWRREKVIFSSPKPFEEFKEDVYFVDPISPKEAFDKSETIGDFIKNVKQ